MDCDPSWVSNARIVGPGFERKVVGHIPDEVLTDVWYWQA